MPDFECRVNETLHRFEGSHGWVVLKVAWEAHRDYDMGVFENSDVCRISSTTDSLHPIPYGSASRITREMAEIGALEHVGGKRPKKYQMTEIGARALGEMAEWRSSAYA